MVFEKPSDAMKAIEEYHGAYLDDKLLTVEYDNGPAVIKVPKVIHKGGKK